MGKHDGHVHTPFCPHGTKDSFDAYCERAISLGFTSLSFTEHAPLPKGFTDPTPAQDSSIGWNELDDYIHTLSSIKKAYRDQLTIYIGLEVDFIEGFEEEICTFLNEYGPLLDDSLLSVHFLKHSDRYFCIDYSPDVFAVAIRTFGSIQAVYDAYYRTLERSITSELGPYKPKRIGHMTLVNKFQKKFPAPSTEHQKKSQLEILHLVKKHGYSLDYNGAGFIKPLCGESYPPESIAKEAVALGIPLIYGSDAHQAKALATGWEQMNATLKSQGE
ncbi:histidinol-phosphatase HisJ [Halalkalibacterium halodurans]|uniref:Histidinol-phosphatase n=2 Tax=Halalkalibacterium halodurans TaxID=86665 RepID=A0A0M0KGU7_ALKHA|nr:histidinol-phosphatase HisJ [Halalkalibacterium halodurans]MED3647193.1 histidinol-phosphatase HisJ [Halalkalibacterium halodurans]TES53231.1 histidinol-phosphatase HisJ [Halalkalibacterium halodurans]TPE69866.1 histidinol-phosphatase HisJ [Halalkalibacterium halodurans]